jgi:hypothetical protein
MLCYFLKGVSSRYLLLLDLCAGLLLAGCAALAPKTVLDETGLRNTDTSTPSTINLFNEHYRQLYDKNFGTRTSAAAQQAGDTRNFIAPPPAVLTAEGANLSYQLCSSFFKSAGTEQQYLLFSRDVIGVLGTLATGVLGATNGSSAATGAVGLTSGALLSGISIYSRNFLFSEDNVQAVQDLTLKAMTAQTTASLERASKPSTNYSFFEAVKDIMDIQAICEVQKILSLVRSSIHQAQPLTTRTPGGQLSTDVGPQQPLTIVGVNALPAAAFLRAKDIRAVQAAVQRVDNLNSYLDRNMRFGTASDITTWLYNSGSDQRHLEDVARSMGWSGQ